MYMYTYAYGLHACNWLIGILASTGIPDPAILPRIDPEEESVSMMMHYLFQYSAITLGHFFVGIFTVPFM